MHVRIAITITVLNVISVFSFRCTVAAKRVEQRTGGHGSINPYIFSHVPSCAERRRKETRHRTMHRTDSHFTAEYTQPYKF
jgi:hypothetical protein